MRLSVLFEDFSREDFFDFYALTAYRNESKELNSYFQVLVNEIYDDLFYGLAKVVLERWSSPSYNGSEMDREIIDKFERSHKDTKAFLDSKGIKYKENNWDGTMTDIEIDEDSIRKIPPRALAQAAKDLAAITKETAEYLWTGDTWIGLVVALSKNIAENTNDKMAAIDRMFQLMHHSGNVMVDKIKGKPWLEDALNIKFAAEDLRQISPFMSNWVRSQVRHIPQTGSRDVSPAAKYAVRFNRRNAGSFPVTAEPIQRNRVRFIIGSIDPKNYVDEKKPAMAAKIENSSIEADLIMVRLGSNNDGRFVEKPPQYWMKFEFEGLPYIIEMRHVQEAYQLFDYLMTLMETVKPNR